MGAFPAPGNPFIWTGVVETDSAIHVLQASALDSDVDPDNTLVFHKAEDSPTLEAAHKTRTASIFMDFARFPWESVEETENGFTVRLQDLRYYSAGSERRGFLAEIELDKNQRVRSESFYFHAPERKRGS